MVKIFDTLFTEKKTTRSLQDILLILCVNSFPFTIFHIKMMFRNEKTLAAHIYSTDLTKIAFHFLHLICLKWKIEQGVANFHTVPESE